MGLICIKATFISIIESSLKSTYFMISYNVKFNYLLIWHQNAILHCFFPKTFAFIFQNNQPATRKTNFPVKCWHQMHFSEKGNLCVKDEWLTWKTVKQKIKLHVKSIIISREFPDFFRAICMSMISSASYLFSICSLNSKFEI